MKAASLLRHIWIGCFICFLYLAATGIAYAGATNNGTNGKGATVTKQEIQVQQTEPSVKKNSNAPDGVAKDGIESKSDGKPAEVKKEGSTTYFSFSFLYYLFYKTNFAETTNGALRNSWNAFISRLID